MIGQPRNPALDKLFSWLTLAGDLILINVLWFLTSLPIVTIGAASSAAYAVLLRRIRMGEEPVTRTWFRFFKQNFKQATAVWLIGLVAVVAAWGDLALALSLTPGFLRYLYLGVGAIIAVMAMVVLFIGLPLQSFFHNTLKGTLVNAFALAFVAPARTIQVWLFWAVALGCPFVLRADTMMALSSLWLLWGLSFPAWLSASVLMRVFAKFDASLKESEDTKDES